MKMIKLEADVQIPKNIQDHKLFSITDLLKPCEDQNTLLKEDDELIGRLVVQLSEYEQELYEKNSYIKKLDDESRQTLKTSCNKREVSVQ